MTMTRPTSALTHDDIVYVRNVGDEPIYGKLTPFKRFVIHPQKTKLMSWGDACLVFGNPFIADPDERERRHGQVMCLYGAFDQRLDAHLIPQLEVTTEDGERVHMLLEDPNGTLNAATLTEDDYGDPRLARINAMLAEIAETKAQILSEHVTDPNGRPLATVGSNPAAAKQAARATVAPETDNYVPVRGGRPADFNTVGASAVDADLLPQGDPHENALPRPAGWDSPANDVDANPAAPSPASLLLPNGTPAKQASGPRREGVVPRAK